MIKECVKLILRHTDFQKFTIRGFPSVIFENGFTAQNNNENMLNEFNMLFDLWQS